MKPKRPPRVDELGRAYRGSQLQVQIYVARRQAELTAAVAKAIGVDLNSSSIKWTAPLESTNFREPVDTSFLSALELSDRSNQLKAFWPKRGPSWDALGFVSDGTGITGFILAEAKSYPGEMRGGGCKATPDSRKIIEDAISRAKVAFGAREDANWLGCYYQYANRLAHLAFLRDLTGRPVWLVNLLFLDDDSLGAKSTSQADWDVALPAIKQELGFMNRIPNVVDVFLDARPREELLAPQ